MSIKKVLVALLCLYFSFPETGFSQSTKVFSFNLTDSATTSAGVFKSDSTLVRMLWSNVKYGGGNHIEKWDGLLDNGALAPNDTYHVEVLSNKVKYNWDGARIGNTSTDFSGSDNPAIGSTIHRAGGRAAGITISGGYLYYAAGYQERYMANFRTNLNTIGKRVRVSGANGNDVAAVITCSDDSTVFWGAYQQGGPKGTFVFGTKTSDNSTRVFTNGVVVTPGAGNPFPSGIAVKYLNDYHSDIWSLAVQRHGNKLFVARADTLTVYNKVTGDLLQTIPKHGIFVLATDTSGNLWVGDSSSIIKYAVNSNGSLVSTGITITGVLNAAAIAVSANNSKVIIADDSLSQQVIKSYNNLTGGSALWTLGTPGGYVKDATVSNSKFYFRDVRTNYLLGLAFQADSSFWVIDAGNTRMQHYSSTGSFLNRIMYIGGAYLLQTDLNDSSRVFCGTGGGDINGSYLEFKIDYTKTLDSGINGSWTLVKNWGGNLGSGYSPFDNMQNVVTLSGHTFAKMTNNIGGGHDIVELVANGAFRKTKVSFDVRQAIGRDGTKYYNPEGNYIGHQSHIYSYAFSGLDSDNDPTWAPLSSGKLIIQTPILDSTAVAPSETSFRANLTSTGKWVTFNPNRVDGQPGNDPHLAIQNIYGSAYKSRSSYGTITNAYSGDFPGNGQFDNGNGVVYAGGYSTVSGRNILWTYHGEFWKASQTNMFNHFWDNGLMVGQFGTLRTDYGDAESVPGGAGNALHGSWVQYNADTAFLYSSDEGVNAGAQRWSITGLRSINSQVCNFNASLIAPALDYVDLMAPVTGKGYLQNNLLWSLSDSLDDKYNIPIGNFWYVAKGSKTSSSFGTQDVYVLYNNASQTKSISIQLGNNSGLSSWKVTGNISFESNTAANSNNSGAYFQVLDNLGKVIATFYEFDSGNFQINANDQTLHNFSSYNKNFIQKSQPFEISNAGSTFTFKYAGYTATTTALAEKGANVQAPTTIRLLFTPGSYTRALGVSALKFQSASLYYRTKASGAWSDATTWQTSGDSTNWKDALQGAPSSNDNSITLQKGHAIILKGTVTADQLYIKDSAILTIAPNASLIINDGTGDDINIESKGSMVIQSDSTGTGRIGNSSGTISGNVTVERYISSSTNRAYRLLSPSVNTLNGPKPYIRNNWQEDQNNINIKSNNNLVPRYGIQITGSTTGANGFDITSKGTASLFTYNPTNIDPSWLQIDNTNATSLEAKKGYLVIIFGDRSTDLRTASAPSSTTLRATGSVATGTQIFTKPVGDRGTIIIGNPYPSPINWNTIYNDTATSNSKNLENYYTYWDAKVGSGGGYVTVNADGVKSAPTDATIEIQSGQAFLVKPKKGVAAPVLTVKESHKSSNNNKNVFRVSQQEQFMSSLYYTNGGRRILADAVNVVFNDAFSSNVDGNDAEEIENADENIAIKRSGKMLSIEERPTISSSDTLPLTVQRLKVHDYEFQFNPTAFFNQNLNAFLDDKFLHILTKISLNETTNVPFSVNEDIASASEDRFRIVFSLNKALPASISAINAYQKTSGVLVNWTAQYDGNISQYDVERSYDGNKFMIIGTVKPSAYNSVVQNYNSFDTDPKQGINYYRIKSIDQAGVTKYTLAVNVTITGVKADINVFPNPVTSNYSVIQFVYMPKGIYTVTLMSNNGQMVSQTTISHPGGSASQIIPIDASLPSGAYTLIIVGNGVSINKKLIKQLHGK